MYFCASSPQLYRVTDFLSLNFPVPVSHILVRDGEMPHSLRQCQEMLIALYKSLIGLTQIVLNTGVGSKIPSCFSVSASTSQLLASGRNPTLFWMLGIGLKLHALRQGYTLVYPLVDGDFNT